MREVKERYGITGIKIWPFDGAAHRSRHQLITPDELDEAVAPIRKLREAFADGIEIMLEFHSNWSLPSALRIAKAVEPYRPMWLEDVLLTGSLKDYRELAAAIATPILLSERGRTLQFERSSSQGGPYVSFDLTWCGGLSLAEGRGAARPTSSGVPHTAGGPLFYASTPFTGRHQRRDRAVSASSAGLRDAEGDRTWNRGRPRLARVRDAGEAGGLEPPEGGRPDQHGLIASDHGLLAFDDSSRAFDDSSFAFDDSS
jgi:hypothetical protein